ncbi:hypothetical protein DVH24_037670 [Malus domestica]|uniref:Uncharacterized protein n=1 Tax=Malus domestica TaxID=3750 RepID=A0A498J075_MALDO|nr:hypothetical protein DVH24_037670 [Malus domestica]
MLKLEGFNLCKQFSVPSNPALSTNFGEISLILTPECTLYLFAVLSECERMNSNEFMTGGAWTPLESNPSN